MAPGASSGPSTSPANPIATRAPPIGTSGASVGTPGSKRSADPAGIASRMPYAAARSNESRGLTSKKWKCDVMLIGTSDGVGRDEVDETGRHRRLAAPRRSPHRAHPSPRLPPSPNGLRTTTMRVPSSNTRLDLDLADDVGHPGQHVVGGEHARPRCGGRHQPSPVARRFAHGVGDQRRRLGNVESQPAGPPGAGELGRREDQQPIAIGWCEAHGPHANVGGIKRSALDNKVLVRFTAAFLFTTLSEWAFYIAALVYAFDRSGCRAAGFASLALLVPIAIAAPAAGKAAQRRRPERVRLIAYAVQTLALDRAALAAYAHAPGRGRRRLLRRHRRRLHVPRAGVCRAAADHRPLDARADDCQRVDQLDARASARSAGRPSQPSCSPFRARHWCWQRAPPSTS